MTTRQLLSAALAAVACIAAGALLWRAATDKPADGPVDIYLGDQRLSVPIAYIRFESARLGGRLEKLDLAARATNFLPAATGANNGPRGKSGGEIVFLSLSPPSGTLAPADRTARLYSRFLETPHWNHPGGLIKRRFQKDSPYPNEDLFLAPPEGRRFAARYLRPRNLPKDLPENLPKKLPSTCLADLRLGNVDVQLRFTAALLPQWEHLHAGAHGLLQSFIRK